VDPPMTEPQRNRNNSSPLLGTPDHTTPRTLAQGRPPQAPKKRSLLSREKRPGSRDPIISTPPRSHCRHEASTPALGIHSAHRGSGHGPTNGGSPEFVTPASRQSARPSSRSALIGKIQQARSCDHPDRDQVHAHHFDHADREQAQELALEQQPDTPSLCLETAEMLGVDPSSLFHGPPGANGGMLVVPTNLAWDAQDSACSSTVTSARRRSANLTCQRGPRGVISFSMSVAAEEEATPEPRAAPEKSGPSTSITTSEPKISATSSKARPQPAHNPNVVQGSCFSWVRGEALGHGSLGCVFKALIQHTGQMFAVKEVRIDKKVESDVKFKTALENEISIYKELQHPNIVSYIGHDYIDNSLYIYLEYMAGGSVSQVLSQFGAFDERLIATYAKQLLDGLVYLHTRQPVVLHRDVKGANILVGVDCGVKLSDFGCSKRTADTMSLSLRGSIPWMAPEVIQQTGYGRRSDVWSLGCVIIEMATGRHPWGVFDNPMAAMMRIGMSDSTPPVPDFVSEACRDFIQQCTQRDKNKRPLANSLVEHEFVRDD